MSGWLLVVSVIGASAALAAPSPFAGAVKDCRPCRFSPGKHAPLLDLTFVFAGTGADRALTAMEIAPAGGGTAQRLVTGGVSVSGFPDGFTIDSEDLDRDGYADLGLVTATAADNATEEYWLYEPASRRFVALVRDDDAGGDCPLRWDAKQGAFFCHIKDSAAAYTDYWYRIEGNRTVAIRKLDQFIEGSLLIHETTDLSAKPPRIVGRATVGFVGDSPERAAFLERLHAAAIRATALYRHGDKGAALAIMVQAFGHIRPYALGVDQPDRALAGDLNNYGFFLEEAGHAYDAIGPLQDALELDPGRIVAYLNLGDAFFAIGNKDAARSNYAEYRKRMGVAGRTDKIPHRVLERLR
ncbi:MAG: tetratricopeptide repeat protein [Acetobacteraceae bacterium]